MPLFSHFNPAQLRVWSLPSLVFALLIIGAGRGEAADQVRDMSDLRQLIHEAVAAKAREVTIPPGIYAGGTPGSEQGYIIGIHGADGLHIKAAGVMMRCTELARALEINNCTGLKISGLTIDYDPLPFTQGTIIAVDPAGAWVDVQLHAGYPLQPYGSINVVDPTTRTRKQGMPRLWGSRSEFTGAGADVVRVHQDGIGASAAVGDFATLRAGPAAGQLGHAIAITGPYSDSNTLTEVTILAAPGAAVVEAEGEGNTTLERVRVIPGPAPDGATEARLMSASWDGFSHMNCRKGPTVERCEISRVGGDPWQLSSSDFVVLKVMESTLLLAPRRKYADKLVKGDELVSGSGAKVVIKEVTKESIPAAEAQLDDDLAIMLKTAEPWDYYALAGDCIELECKGKIPFKRGDSIVSPDRRAHGFSFTKNQVGGPGRIVVQASKGKIEGNLIEDTGGIIVDANVPDRALVAIDDIVIRNNKLVRTGYNFWNEHAPPAGAISVVAGSKRSPIHGGHIMRDPGTINRIVIEKNTFEGSNGISILCGSVHGLVVRGNRISGSHQQEPHPAGQIYRLNNAAAIFIDRCTDVTLTGNKVSDAGPFLKEESVVREDEPAP